MIENVNPVFNNYRVLASSYSVPKKTVEKDNSVKYDRKNIILATTMAGSGAILLTLGVLSPTKSSIIKKLVKERKSQMSLELGGYKTTVGESVETLGQRLSEYIKNFIEQNTIEMPVKTTPEIKNIKEHAINQNKLFEKIANSGTEPHKAGASERDSFSVESGWRTRVISNHLAHKKELLRLLFGDFCQMPNLKDKSLDKLLELSKSELESYAQSCLTRMEAEKELKITSVTQQYYRLMVKAIADVRENKLNAKKELINKLFEDVRKFFNLEEAFKPNYQEIPTLENFSKLTPLELKPQSISETLTNQFGTNIYFKTAANSDFTQIKQEDLQKLFYSAGYENNLQDLRFLIDRLRLYQKIGEKTSNPELICSNMIVKLEFLANKLNDFGNSELAKRCSKDFDKMNKEQKDVAMYYIDTVARRLGISSFDYLKGKNII